MKHQFWRMLGSLVLALLSGCGVSRRTDAFVVNPDQSVRVTVSDMPITTFIDHVNEACMHSELKVHPVIVVRPEWHAKNRKANIQTEPLINLDFQQTSLSNVVDILCTQYTGVVFGVGTARRLAPDRIPLSQGGGNWVRWKGLPDFDDGVALVSQSAELLKTALGKSGNVKVEVLPSQLSAFPIMNLTDDLSPMSVNDFVQLVESSFPVIFDITNDCIVVRFDEDHSIRYPPPPYFDEYHLYSPKQILGEPQGNRLEESSKQ